MANLAQTIEVPKSKLAIAHNALKAATMLKCKYVVGDYTDLGDNIEVDYYISQGTSAIFDSAIIAKVTLIDFIGNFYRDIVDTFFNGEHDQYTDTANPAVYLEENMSEVLTDFLNNQ